MIFKDSQRRAMFANMFSNKNKILRINLDDRPIFNSDRITSLADKLRYSPDFVEGYTGAIIQLPDRYVNGPKAFYGKKLDLEDDVYFYHNSDEDKDTYILAGEDFKRGLYQKNIPELRNITLGSDENKEFIKEAAAMERAVGRPVYSSKPKDKMTALELAKQTYENLLENPNMTYEESLHASKGYLRELADTKDGSVRKWANKELDDIYHDQRTEYEEMRAEGIDINFSRSNKFSYAPIYGVSDLSAMGVDAIGTAGATTVSLVPIAVTLGGLYVGATLALKGTDKLKKQYNKTKSRFSDDPLMDYYNSMKKREIAGEIVKGQELVVDGSRVKDFSPDKDSKQENIKKYSTIL